MTSMTMTMKNNCLHHSTFVSSFWPLMRVNVFVWWVNLSCFISDSALCHLVCT